MTNSKEYSKQYYAYHKKEINNKAREYYSIHREALKKTAIKWRKRNKKRILEIQKKYFLTPKGRLVRRTIGRNYVRRQRQELIKGMGGECIKCRFSDWRALQIDHIDGNGTSLGKFEKSMGANKYKNYVLIRKNKDYQLLCSNCNWIKKYERNENVGGIK